MYLDTKHKILFIHIPRTGGSWLGYKMMDFCYPMYRGVGQEIFTKSGEKYPVGRHTTLEKIYSLQHLIQDDINTYYKIAVSRHPYTRFISAFDYFKNITDTAERHNLKTLEDMMSWIEDGADKQHILPQSYWYDERFNNFYKFENIEDLNLQLWIPKWHNSDTIIQKGKRRGIQKSKHKAKLSEKLKERIFKFYNKDFYLFDYVR